METVTNRGERMLNNRNDHARATIHADGNGKKYQYILYLLDMNGAYTGESTVYSNHLLTDNELRAMVTIPDHGALKVCRLYNSTIFDYANNCAIRNNYVNDVYTLASGSNGMNLVPYVYSIAAQVEGVKLNYLKRWEYSAGYSGADLRQFYVVIGYHGESGVLAHSNYRVMLGKIQDLLAQHEIADRFGVLTYDSAPNFVTESGGQIILGIAKMSSDMVGWTKHLYIHHSAPRAILIEIDDMLCKMAEEYPILSDDDYSDLLADEIFEYWARGMAHDDKLALCKELGVDGRAARSKNLDTRKYPAIYDALRETFESNGWA